MMALMSQQPAPRSIDRWEKAEENAAAWMRYWGFTDARVTPPGSDRGIDVRAGGALAQVKWAGKSMGSDAVQRLFGAGGPNSDKMLLFFTGPGHGFSQRAIDDAERLGVALFRYDIHGSVRAVNASARRIVEAASGADGAPTISYGVGRDHGGATDATSNLGCAVLVALFFTIVVVASAAGVVAGGPDQKDAVNALAVSGLFAGFLWWCVWMIRRSRR